MAILPKYQLQALFEAGDLMTETTLGDFIDSAYNPILVGGTGVTLTTVSTPSGDTITISSTGGGGAPIIEGDGIKITTVGTDKKIAVDLDTSQTNLIFNGNKELSFAGVHVQDEGSTVGTYKTFNFIGIDVLAEDSGTPGKVNVYIPTPQFASHYNTTDGTTTGTVSESGFTRSNVRISTPQDEAAGIPFKTGGWAATTKPAYNNTTTAINIFTTAQQVTGFSPTVAGDAKIEVTIYDADGTTILKTHTTSVIYQDGDYDNGDNDIKVNISQFASDASKKKAKVTVQAVMADIFSNNLIGGRSGGRYHVKVIMTTDSATDGSGPYTYTQSDVFWDINDLGGYPSTPSINGSVAIVESSTPTSILTKHLSGVEYYKKDSEFMIDVTDIDNLNANTQGRTLSDTFNFVAQGPDYGLTDLNLKAWAPGGIGSFVGWSNDYNEQDIDYDRDDWPITSNEYRFRNTDASILANVSDPWLISSNTSSVGKPILIDTYLTTSDKLTEGMNDEAQRLERGASSYTNVGAFPSTSTLTPTGLANQTTSSLTTGPFCQAAVVGGSLVRPDKFFADNGNSPAYSTIISDLSQAVNPYKPNKFGNNPDYSGAGYQVAATYHRLFQVQNSNFNRPISNFVLTFSGSYPGGSALAALQNNDLRIYIRKLAAANSTNIGFAAVPHSLHNSNTFGGYQDPPTAIDDNSTSQARLGSSSSNAIGGSFGGFPAMNGFYIEVQIHNPAVRIDGISALVNFSSGSPTSETGGSV